MASLYRQICVSAMVSVHIGCKCRKNEVTSHSTWEDLVAYAEAEDLEADDLRKLMHHAGGHAMMAETAGLRDSEVFLEFKFNNLT